MASSHSFDHEFDELEVVVGGIRWFLSGSCSCSYNLQPAEPDVGIMSAFPEDVVMDDDALDLTGFFALPEDFGFSDTYYMGLARGMFAFACVEAALQPKLDDAAANGEGDYGPDPDDSRDDDFDDDRVFERYDDED